MADIRLICPACGHSVSVSEYANVTTVPCTQCGTHVPRTAAETLVMNTRIKLRETEKAQSFETIEEADVAREQAEANSSFHQIVEAAKPKGKSQRPQLTLYLLSWFVFILLGAISGWLRYGGILSSGSLGTMQFLAPWIGLVLHLVVLSMAFKDTVFQGILCLLIPGYSVYYLIFISDQFFIRAAFFGIMVGLAQDAGAAYYEMTLAVIDEIRGFINTGGGEVEWD